MDKNTITGIILIGIVLYAFSWWSQPSKEEIAQLQLQDSIATAQRLEAERINLERSIEAEAAKAALATDSTALFFAHRTGEAQNIVLENAKVRLTLSTKGGCIQQAEIKGYKSRQTEGDVTILNPNDAHLSLSLAGKQDNLLTDDFYFAPSEVTDSTVTMTLKHEGKTLTISYTLRPDSYMTDIAIQTVGLEGFFAPNVRSMNIMWTDHVLQQEKGYDFENRYSSLTYKRTDKGTKNLNENSNDTREPEDALDWVAFKNQFFSAVLIAPQSFTGARLSSQQEQDKKSGYLKTYTAQMDIPFAPGSVTQMQMYLGPNDYSILHAHNHMSLSQKDLQLEELVYLGWWIFRWVNRWLIMPLFNLLSSFGWSMGIVLLLLTLVVKALVYPTTKKSYLSGAKMRVLKPQVDALNAKYPNQADAMKKQQEMMQLYSQYGVSPMGGCLPMLIQMPIWLALFNFVPNAIEFRGQSFLWAEDLSAYDDLINWGTDLWLIGDHLSIFCILFCATNIINTWINMRQQQSQLMGEQAQQMKMMQYMMYIMPLMFFFIFNNYSSGLCYYYFLSGLSSILIMWYLRHSTDDAKLLAKLEAYKQQHKNDPKKTSSLAARLEALQRMQEEQTKRKK